MKLDVPHGNTRYVFVLDGTKLHGVFPYFWYRCLLRYIIRDPKYGQHASRNRPAAMNYISEHKLTWVDEFDDIARFLRIYLPHGLQIHHVGSTAVSRMPAKDIIDIDIECPCESMSTIVAHLAEAGYEHMGDQGIPAREAFRPCEDSVASRLRPHHLYACETDAPELRRHLAFRDYLLANPERADWLANAKRRADHLATSRTAYIDSKSTSYEIIVSEAMCWEDD